MTPISLLGKLGTGVQRMMDACKDAGLPEPEYGTDGSFMWITFKRRA
jgi:ATP-dependent DNA helicase RecG